jgi:hypothetical protein
MKKHGFRSIWRPRVEFVHDSHALELLVLVLTSGVETVFFRTLLEGREQVAFSAEVGCHSK